MNLALPLRLVLALVCISLAIGEAHSQTPASGPARRAHPLDSAGRVEKETFLNAFASLRNSDRAAYDSARKLMALVTHMALGRLGYISGPFDFEVTPTLSAAIRAYEIDRGLPTTGDPLSFELAKSLRADERVLEAEITLPSRTISETDGYLLATGAWTFNEMGDQAIAVEVTCQRSEMRCSESQAIFRADFLGSPMLSVDHQTWAISRWDSFELTTAPVDFSCARYIMRINLVQKTGPTALGSQAL